MLRLDRTPMRPGLAAQPLDQLGFDVADQQVGRRQIPPGDRLACRREASRVTCSKRLGRYASPVTSSVQTLKLCSVFGPKVVLIATSAASRPRAIRMRPMRGVLLRGVEGVPAAAEIGLEPAGEIHRRRTAAARRCRRDSRCSSAPGCSCSGRARREVGEVAAHAAAARCRPPTRCWSRRACW